MFDVTEAINDIIDENYNESCYNAIYEELCERVENGELTLEDAEMINEAAYDKYLTEFKSDIQRYYDDRRTQEKLSHNHNADDRFDYGRVNDGYHRRGLRKEFTRKGKAIYDHGKHTHSAMYHGGNPYNGTPKYNMGYYKSARDENDERMETNDRRRFYDKRETRKREAEYKTNRYYKKNYDDVSGL